MNFLKNIESKTKPEIFRWQKEELNFLSSSFLLSTVLGSGLDVDQLRVAIDGKLIDLSLFTSETNDEKILINQEQVLSLYQQQRATLIFQNLSIPSLDNLKKQLIKFGFGNFQINAYLSPSKARGFPPHWDLHEAILFQAEGSKNWELIDPIDANPFFSADKLGLTDTVGDLLKLTEKTSLNLQQGSALYIPRGFIHSGESSRIGSLHFTLGFRKKTVLDSLFEAYPENSKRNGLESFLITKMNNNIYCGDQRFEPVLSNILEQYEAMYA